MVWIFHVCLSQGRLTQRSLNLASNGPDLLLARHLRSQRFGAFVKDIEIRLIRKDTIAAFARDLAHNAQAAKPLDGRAYRWEG